MTIKIHPREDNVKRAGLKLLETLLEIQKDLTPGEYLRVVAEQLGGAMATIAKYQIREERHPEDPDKPGGLE